jgi:DHHC palmitoyltransferase
MEGVLARSKQMEERIRYRENNATPADAIEEEDEMLTFASEAEAIVFQNYFLPNDVINSESTD